MPPRAAGRAHQQRHARQHILQPRRPLLHQAVVAGVVAVVRPDCDGRDVPNLGVVHRRQQQAEEEVGEGDAAEVDGVQLAKERLVERADVAVPVVGV